MKLKHVRNVKRRKENKYSKLIKRNINMNYKFTALLIVMMTLLALFGGPAQ